MDIGDALEILQSMHPRTIFFKSLRRHSTLLDVGAGDGSLCFLKGWIKPQRKDLKLYAYAMEFGANFEAFDGYELGEWPLVKPDFDGRKFDAITSCHFIEHILDPVEFVRWAADRLNSGGGRMYIEWPSENSRQQVQREVYRKAGVPIVISNYHDDSTHKLLPVMSELVEVLVQQGLVIEQQGSISNPFLEQELLSQFKSGDADEFSVQAAFWSKTRWAQYLVAAKD